MGYERYPRNTNPQRSYYDRSDPQDYGRNDGRDDNYARDRDAAGRGDGQRGLYGGNDPDRDPNRGYGRDQTRYGYGSGGDAGDRGRYGQSSEYHGSYASDGHRFEDVGRYAHADDDNYARDRQDRARRVGGQSQGRPQGYDDQDRGFFQRAGDEVRSWFGDEEAERRRDLDQRYDNRGDTPASRHRDSDYHSWRSGQIAAFDRDYDEYRQEHRAKFENEFASWRTARQGQRDSLSQVGEHMDVVGSDGEHVGTVDKVRGDRILLTRNDADAGGRHHSIPSRWVQSVDGKVTLTKTAADAKQHWQDEKRNQAMFQFGDKTADTSASSNAEADADAATSSRSGARTY